ncbi:enolase 4-like [Oculina patagonica]
MAVKNGAYSLEEKREAVAYFNKNEVPKQIEELLNKMFKEKPNDVFGYMGEYFGKRSHVPTISKVSATEILGSRGFPTFEVSFDCTINGLSKPVASVVSPVDSSPSPDSVRAKVKTPDMKTKTPDQPKQQKATEAAVASSIGESETVAKGLEVDEMIERIDDVIAPLIVGSDPTDQNNMDEVLLKLAEQEKTALKVDSSEGIEVQTEEGLDLEKAEDNQDTSKKSNVSRGESKQSHISQETAKKADGKKGAAANKDSLAQAVPDLEEEELCRDCAMIAVSMGTAVTGAKIKGVSLYEHLAKLSGKETDDSFSLPIPMMTLLTSGKLAAGKQNLIKEVFILPKPGTPMQKVIHQFTNIHQRMADTLAQKYGPSGRCINDDGSFTPSMDKPEQALDFVQDVVSTCGYSLGTDVQIALNCAASEFYDQEKQKYEIMANTFKSLDDVINLYCELHERYPGIIAIVDGVRSPDREGWKKLNQRIGEKCFIVGSDLYRKHCSILECGVTDKLSSVVALSLDQANTITGLSQMAKTVKDQGGLLALADGPCADSSSILADLAVAFGARFIKLGGPVRAEHVSKYRRLQQIEQELEQRGRLAAQEQHVFPVINIVEQEAGESEQK